MSRSIKAATEKSSVYAKDSQGRFQRINGKLEHRSLQDGPLFSDPEIVEESVVFESEDSDDAYEAGFRPALPKERPREHFCMIFKEVDLYGIQPTLFIGGK